MREVIKPMLAFMGWISIASGLLWTFVSVPGEDHWLWFSRYFVGLVLLGLWSIIDVLEENGKRARLSSK